MDDLSVPGLHALVGPGKFHEDGPLLQSSLVKEAKALACQELAGW